MTPFLSTRRGLRFARPWWLALPVLVSACAASTGGAPDASLRGIDFLAEVAPSSPGLSARVTIANRRAEPVVLAFPDGCLALLRAYEGESDRLAPVWDQRDAVACDPASASIELAPGERREVPVPPVDADQILGDTLPDGTYRLTAYLRPEGRVVEVEAGTVELAVSR